MSAATCAVSSEESERRVPERGNRKREIKKGDRALVSDTIWKWFMAD